MNLEAIQALGLHDEVPGALRPLAPAAGTTDFGAQVAQGLQELNQQLLASQVDLQRMAAGETANLHEVMVRLEEGRIALQLALQVRNRALEAYQDLMRMQI
ncbi:flagellar hook-basal body complex protein FliE [Ramlibacter monticola]|uniref:Flagellar hook-basal body complex protein FliE n=1 Tax=Ramlibacter monticola TaxID=1926872 RepID=A0A936Z2G9_9BURK|nr:flagellar hook-basal body complex protein FliE [Ramlibacter monticola]MBL0393508.1 flagellar hook-basal body complex protein FliE [Ramlibacter monticola]